MTRPRAPVVAGEAFWAEPVEALCTRLSAGAEGLSSEDAAARLANVGPNALDPREGLSAIRLLARQFASPLVLILIFGAGVSITLRQWVDAAIILAIVLGSGLLSFPSVPLLGTSLCIVFAYALVTELAKRRYYARSNRPHA